MEGREQLIQDLIAKYRVEFYRMTGLELDCSPHPPRMSAENVLTKAGIFYGLTRHQIVAKVRYANIIEIRQMIVGICVEQTDIDDDLLAVTLDCDRTTIISTRRRFQYKYEHNAEFKVEFDEFKKFVYK